MKLAGIESTTIQISGQWIDINADISDQLRTIDEGLRDITSFVLTQSFPELSELEIQAMLRQLEADGFIEPVDLTGARRPVSRTEIS